MNPVFQYDRMLGREDGSSLDTTLSDIIHAWRSSVCVRSCEWYIACDCAISCRVKLNMHTSWLMCVHTDCYNQEFSTSTSESDWWVCLDWTVQCSWWGWRRWGKWGTKDLLLSSIPRKGGISTRGHPESHHTSGEYDMGLIYIATKNLTGILEPMTHNLLKVINL